ncbi:pyridine nucleotide-disulfide oxidoreductase [Rhodococcus sp. 14-2483-1-1]|uniref:NAD(P)/FAD-dependent oxidoreductase n=1 Tax=Rhodococcus sp. 14-2483-1-1 TaxID=2023148 RepID=UPI000B9BC407|nr:FAD-dependent oxidoreductase [Rhodococcus sp. 14-2483-1-1]OZF41681.1 pyridine nucleotide-disulfide oxidoreductase [Rhodococcus sp. 14-2483-1-1]
MTSAGVDGRHDVLVLGGGNAGVSAAARALRLGNSDVAVIEPQSVHTYQPLLSYVGGGQARLRDAERTQRSVMPKGSTWIQDTVALVDPHEKVVTTASGRRYGYRDLIIGTGLVPDHEALPGITAAADSDAVTSNYLGLAEKTWHLISHFPSPEVGNSSERATAVFTVPQPPVGCTGTTLKPLFLAAAHWRATGQLADIDITLVIDREGLLDVPGLDSVLLDHLRDLGVRILHRTAVTALSPETRQITVTDHHGTQQIIDYRMLHLVPPFRGQPWVESSKLTGDGQHGLVDIDPRTLRHREHSEIWAAGDGAGIDTDSSGGGLRKQITVLIDNLLAARDGREMSSYDGYTVAPVTIDAHRLVAAEFDRTGALTPSLPSFLDPLKARRSAWLFDRYGLPLSYWNMILRGRL